MEEFQNLPQHQSNVKLHVPGHVPKGLSAERVTVKRSPKYKLNGTASYLHALRKYQKYGFTPPYIHTSLLFPILICIVPKGRFFSFRPIDWLSKMTLAMYSATYLQRMSRMIQCTFVPWRLVKAPTLSLWIWISIQEVLIFGVSSFSWEIDLSILFRIAQISGYNWTQGL